MSSNLNCQTLHSFTPPLESVDNVLAIRFGGENALPIEVAMVITSPTYMAAQDAEYAKDASMANDYYEQLNYMLTRVNDAISTGSKHEMTKEDTQYLITMAGNIYWLTERGFIKQTEYNGTQFAYIQ